MTKNCNIDDLTLGQIRELRGVLGTGAAPAESGPGPYAGFVGKAVHIRTVTLYYTGRLTEVHPQELVLEDAAWVADMGRCHTALEKGDLKEVEPYPAGRCVVGRGAIIDCVEWKHELPRQAK